MMKKIIVIVLLAALTLSMQGCGKKITDIYISQKNAEIKVDEEIKLSYTVFPEDAKAEGIKWTSTNSEAATVDENGSVKAISPGETTIICSTPSGLKATCDVTVMAPSAIEQLNKEELGLFNYLVKDMLTSFYNSTAVRIRNIYGDVSSGLFTIDIQGTNKLGGTINKPYLIINNKGKYSYIDVSDTFDRSVGTVTNPSIMDYTKINAALDEYWKGSGIK